MASGQTGSVHRLSPLLRRSDMHVPLVVDADGHCQEPEEGLAQWMPKELGSRPGMRDPRQRLVDMDHEGIDVAIIFGTSIALTVNGLQDKALAGAICHAVNCWLLEYVAADPKRLKAVGRSSSGSHQT